jgi:putative thioredoxin
MPVGFEPGPVGQGIRDFDMFQDTGMAAAPADNLVVDTTTQGFVKDVIEASKTQPVLVDFWAPWCGPCKQLTPIIEKVVRAAKGKVKLAKMDIDKHPAIPGQLGIQSIPAVIAFVNGQPVDGFMGALPESQVAGFIERLIKGKVDDNHEEELLKSGEAALAENDFAGAAEVFAHILAENSASIPALAGLARSHIGAGNIAQARRTLDLVPEGKHSDPAYLAAKAAIDLAEQASNVGPVGELEARVAANPADHQSRFDLAVALNAQGNREGATDHLLEIVKRDRKWNDDGARKQLVQLFDAWGPTDDATVNGRRRLSSILFA